MWRVVTPIFHWAWNNDVPKVLTNRSLCIPFYFSDILFIQNNNVSPHHSQVNFKFYQNISSHILKSEEGRIFWNEGKIKSFFRVVSTNSWIKQLYQKRKWKKLKLASSTFWSAWCSSVSKISHTANVRGFRFSIYWAICTVSFCVSCFSFLIMV